VAIRPRMNGSQIFKGAVRSRLIAILSKTMIVGYSSPVFQHLDVSLRVAFSNRRSDLVEDNGSTVAAATIVAFFPGAINATVIDRRYRKKTS
jgi:hypothetical protein